MSLSPGQANWLGESLSFCSWPLEGKYSTALLSAGPPKPLYSASTVLLNATVTGLWEVACWKGREGRPAGAAQQQQEDSNHDVSQLGNGYTHIFKNSSTQ